MSFSFVVVVVPFEIKHVLVKLVLGISSLFLLHFHLFVRLLHFLVLVAVIVPSCLLAMFCPVAQTQPAKFKAASLASHVIATLVLFDGFLTVGALLGVGHDPGNVLALSRILHSPTHGDLAVAWTMRFSATLEAERITALANDIFHAEILVLHTVVTTLVGTPPDILVVISVSFAMPLHISYQRFTLQ